MAGENRYINIKGDRVWVKGARRSALYDTENYKIYPFNEHLTQILSLGQQQIPIDNIYLRLNSEDNGVKEKVIEAVLEHPFLSLSQTPAPFPEARDLQAPYRPDFLWLELTRRCNLRCLHCYAEAGKNIKDGSLSTDDYKRIIKQASRLGFKSIQFTGGEATLHPDLMELLKYVKESGYEFIELYTNAFNLPNGLIDFVAQNGIKIATSFYSHQSKTHDRITRRKGSFEQTAGNIPKMVKLKIPLRVGIIKLRYNQNDTEKARACLISLGVDSKSIEVDTVRPSGRGCHPELIPDERDFSQEPDRHCIKQNETFMSHWLTKEDENKSGETPDLLLEGNYSPVGQASRLSKKVFSGEKSLTIPGTCWNGKMALTPSGDVIPCVFARDLSRERP
ncbi:MAG: radical SAM protein [Pseudomonadota bacterium]